MHGKALHVSKVDVALGHDSSFLCMALFNRRLHGQLSDLSLLAQVFFNELAQDRDVHRQLKVFFILIGLNQGQPNLSFAAGTIEVAESEAKRVAPVLQELQDAIGMEYVATCEAHACLFCQLTSVADATQLTLGAVRRDSHVCVEPLGFFDAI